MKNYKDLHGNLQGLEKKNNYRELCFIPFPVITFFQVPLDFHVNLYNFSKSVLKNSTANLDIVNKMIFRFYHCISIYSNEINDKL